MSGCEEASHCDSINISLKKMTLSIFPRPYWLFVYILWRNIYPNNSPVNKLSYAVMGFSMVFSHMCIIILCSYSLTSPRSSLHALLQVSLPLASSVFMLHVLHYCYFPLFLLLKNFFSPLNYTHTHIQIQSPHKKCVHLSFRVCFA